jgi:predicted transcriptional regulator
MQITITLPDDIAQQFTLRAAQRNMPVEMLITESLLEFAQMPDDPDDTPNELVLASLHRALEDVQAGRVIPIEELWDGIDV